MSQPSGPAQIMGDLVKTTPTTPPPPGAPPLPLPTTGAVQTTQGTPPPPPPDYTALGKQEAQAQFSNQFAKNGYEFDPDALQKVIDEVQGVLTDELQPVSVRNTIKSPADDVISKDYIDSAVKSIKTFNDAHNAITDYLQSYVWTLRQIRDAYVQQDEAALDALRGVTGKD